MSSDLNRQSKTISSPLCFARCTFFDRSQKCLPTKGLEKPGVSLRSGMRATKRRFGKRSFCFCDFSLSSIFKMIISHKRKRRNEGAITPSFSIDYNISGISRFVNDKVQETKILHALKYSNYTRKNWWESLFFILSFRHFLLATLRIQHPHGITQQPRNRPSRLLAQPEENRHLFGSETTARPLVALAFRFTLLCHDPRSKR